MFPEHCQIEGDLRNRADAVRFANDLANFAIVSLTPEIQLQLATVDLGHEGE